MMRPGSREAKRMMERMGINSKEFPEVKEVIFKTETKELLIRSPKVTAIDFQGQKIFQVIGGEMKEQAITSTKTTQETPKPGVPDEDAQLVAAQANVSLDQARRTLEETGGDLAQAILLLTSRKR
jgi:nascent polypeptide-associated complex subunit alpha